MFVENLDMILKEYLVYTLFDVFGWNASFIYLFIISFYLILGIAQVTELGLKKNCGNSHDPDSATNVNPNMNSKLLILEQSLLSCN